jgi:SPP1 family predicted phage head-tail adaptor
MATNIGRLRYKVDLQKATDTADGGGGRSQAYSNIAQIYADIRPQSGTEQYRQGKVQDKTTHNIFVRHRADISTAYRIKYENRLFNIRQIINVDERDRFLKLVCDEGVVS